MYKKKLFIKCCITIYNLNKSKYITESPSLPQNSITINYVVNIMYLLQEGMVKLMGYIFLTNLNNAFPLTNPRSFNVFC